MGHVVGWLSEWTSGLVADAVGIGMLEGVSK